MSNILTPTPDETHTEPVSAPVPPVVDPTLHPGDSFNLNELKEEGVFASLFANIRDVFAPAKLPPLVLESTPIAVPDRMATKMSKPSIAASIAFYSLLILLFAWIIAHQVKIADTPPKTVITQLTVPMMPPPIPPKAQSMGGGGGQHNNAPVSAGHLPKFDTKQILPPKAPPTIAPKLVVEPTLVMQKDLKMPPSNLPNLGDPSATSKGPFSMGNNGSGGGLGEGNGPGKGPGSGGNMGGGVYRPGGGASAPKPIQPLVEAEFTEEARKAKFTGAVMVRMIVDEQGNATHVSCVHDVGMGLGDKAVEAARQYKFKPALKDGKPVKFEIYVEVNFQIF